MRACVRARVEVVSETRGAVGFSLPGTSRESRWTDLSHHLEQPTLHNFGEPRWIYPLKDLVDVDELLGHQVYGLGRHLACLGRNDALPSEQTERLILGLPHLVAGVAMVIGRRHWRRW